MLSAAGTRRFTSPKKTSHVVLVLKSNPPAPSVGDIRDAGSIPGLGRSL